MPAHGKRVLRRMSVLQFDPQLSAKVFKRVAQLRRLGPRGIIHTAYVRTLGPAVYALTDPARNVAAGLHRQRALGRALPLRLKPIKERASSEINGGQRGGSASTRIEVLDHSSRRLRLCLTLLPPDAPSRERSPSTGMQSCITCEYVEDSGDALNERCALVLRTHCWQSTARATCSAQLTPTTLSSAQTVIRSSSISSTQSRLQAFRGICRFSFATSIVGRSMTCSGRASSQPIGSATCFLPMPRLRGTRPAGSPKFTPPWCSATTSGGKIRRPRFLRSWHRPVELHHEGTPPDPSRWNRPRPG